MLKVIRMMILYEIIVVWSIDQEQRSVEEINTIKYATRDMVFAMTTATRKTKKKTPNTR